MEIPAQIHQLTRQSSARMTMGSFWIRSTTWSVLDAHCCLRSFAVAALAVLLTPYAQAQITNLTNQTSTPIPGAGHDYLHLLAETVNPANGTVSIRISPPMPKGRGVSLPFSFSYDSGSAVHLMSSGPATTLWTTNEGYLSQGGWSYSVPTANLSGWTAQVAEADDLFATCYYTANAMFKDSGGGNHSLNLAVGDTLF